MCTDEDDSLEDLHKYTLDEEDKDVQFPAFTSDAAEHHYSETLRDKLAHSL